MPIKNIRYDKVTPRPRMIEKKTIWQFDWDVLIILDACRYDCFLSEYLGDFGTSMRDLLKPYKMFPYLNSYYSVGSSTGEWTKNTFTEKDENLLYISTNPHISNFMTPSIIGFIPCEIKCLLKDGHWNEKLSCVKPEAVNEVALENLKTKKRLIVHYIQPHHPFIGPNHPIEAVGYTAWKTGVADPGDTVWDLFAKEKITREEVYDAYKDNLHYVLDYVESFVEELLKKTEKRFAITADHGNLFGEYGLCCHPSGYEYEELIRVPFLAGEYVNE